VAQPLIGPRVPAKDDVDRFIRKPVNHPRPKP